MTNMTCESLTKSYFSFIFSAPDKPLFSTKKYWWFSYFSRKAYVVGSDKKCLDKELLISIHNICFCGEIRKKKYLPDTSLIWSYSHGKYFTCQVISYKIYETTKTEKLLVIFFIQKDGFKDMYERQPLTYWTQIYPAFANSVDPDQLAWRSQLILSALFAIKYVNLYQQSGSSNLIGWKLEMGLAS